MSIEDGQGPASFEPVKVGPRRRRVDPVALGVVMVVLALVLAVVKPWDGAGPGLAPSSAPDALIPAVSPSPSPSAPTRGALVPPTWSDVVSVISRQSGWGIRTIVLGAPSAPDPDPIASPPPSPPASGRYAERWFPTDADGGEDATAIVDEPDGQIIALGVTFPPTETPLDVRIWLDHADGELEWMDVRPVNDVPARGAYLYLRRGVAGAAVRAWAPGRYRMDVLVAGAIHRIDVLIRDRTGRLPEPDPWLETETDPAPLYIRTVGSFPAGPFVESGGEVTPLRAGSGPPLDEVAAWLDVDPAPGSTGQGTFVARTYVPDVTQMGVVLPPYSRVDSASIRRLAPFDDARGLTRKLGIGSLAPVSFVAFGPTRSVTWRPGVYAISVAWQDDVGSHEGTWHIELRPGPPPATPLLLAATRDWASYVGSTGILLGVTEPLSGTDPLGVRLVDIMPQTQPGYPGLSGEDLIGCGPTHVQGRPEVIGIVGSADHALIPVAARILYPFDQGPLEVLTASGSVPGLTLITPSVTAEFGGPASYGLRAGTGRDAPGYTICIGMPGG